MNTLKIAAKRIAVGLVATVASTVAILAIPVESPRDGAQAWAASLNESQRSSYFQPERLASLPSDYRRALSKVPLSQQENMAFWRSTFAAFRNRRALTAEQSNLVGEAEALIPAAFGGSTPRAIVAQKLAALRPRLIASFGKEVADELFLAKGPEPSSTSALPIGERLRLAWRTNRPTALVAAIGYVFPTVQAVGDCNCSDQGDCFYSQTCGLPNGLECEPYEPPFCGPGCGDWNCYGCWMFCYYPA